MALGPRVREYAVGDRVGGAVKRGLTPYARAEAASPLLARVHDAIGDDVAAAAAVIGVTGLEIVHAAGDVRDVYAPIARDELTILVGATYTFADAPAALRRLAGGSSAKIVVRVHDALGVTRRA